LENGTKFDSSRDRGEHYVAPLGIGRVIKAWDLGISTFKKGELSKLICKPEYAYGYLFLFYFILFIFILFIF
jgi:FKBP-type peptidyl-prolyl cis-trans isomerase